MRTGFAAGAIAALIAIGSATPLFAQSSDKHMRVVLVGTGGPEINPARFGYSTLIEAGGQR
ncbi:MAG TPA: MBL fold metallo-hydrolase, partial [Thermoanaerobaculia bacterium]|nr:MBL fold metallo-hydrolase [Thermoanaerobaculia bacterium]